jgi:5-methylcytosine-specific restriction endonuclease McrA
MYPFTIRIVDRKLCDSVVNPVRLKVAPGSKKTGVALTVEAQDEPRCERVLWLGEIQHRGDAIRDALEKRNNYRRRRRSVNLRYRAPRFNNRRKPSGWLAPSVRHRVKSTTNLVTKLRKLAPVAGFTMQLVKFDTQKMQAPEISGVEYQRGELFGYEVREYLLEKWGRKCAYCGTDNIPLQIDHIVPKSTGGSDRVSNLTLACAKCNQGKGSQPVKEYLKRKPAVLKKILATAKISLRDAAAVNSTRWALFSNLKDIGLPLKAATGGRTKWNRIRFGIPKAKALDAACVGKLEQLSGWAMPILVIKCMGRGQYRRTLVDAHGFPRGYLMRSKSVHGFQTGDIVRVNAPKGKAQGIHIGRVAVRKSGSFDILTRDGKHTVSYRYCTLQQRTDGYAYSAAS